MAAPEDGGDRAPLPVRLVAGISHRLNLAAAAIAAVLLVLMVGLILAEIGLRFFSHSTYMADALVGHGVAATTFLALGWALEQNTMIRVSVVTDRTRGAVRWLFEMFAVAAAEAIVVFLITYQWATTEKLWMRGSVSQHYLPIPLWIPEALFLVGLGLLALQLLVRLLRLVTVGHREEASLSI